MIARQLPFIARIAPVLRRMTASVIGIAAALVVAEFGARFVFERAAANGVPVHAAKTAFHSGDAQTTVNSLGFREREPGPKNPDRYRIAVIGDSYTWGQALQDRERFSNVLGDFLGPRYDVLNFGMPGNTIPEDLDELEQVLKVSPDFVLLQMYINNFETPGMRRPQPHPLLPTELDRQLLASSVVYRLLSDRFAQFQESVGLVDSYQDYMARHLRDPEAPDARESFARLRQFFDRAREARVPSGAVLFPAADAMGPFGTNYSFGYLHDHVKAVCAAERVQCLDLLPLFSTRPDPRTTWVTPFDAHPNAETNRRAAIEILGAFSPLWRR
jgi:lysophospholipase L1-like esterase